MSVEDRLSRMESLASIQQLAYRYALAVDSRDTVALADLFVPDVRVGPDTGRAALARWFDQILRRPGASVHLVANHIIDFDDPSTASGVVYCREPNSSGVRTTPGRWAPCSTGTATCV